MNQTCFYKTLEKHYIRTSLTHFPPCAHSPISNKGNCTHAAAVLKFSCNHKRSSWGWNLNVDKTNLLSHRARGADSPRLGARARKKESEGGGWAAGARQTSGWGGQGRAGQTGCRPAEDPRATGECCLTCGGSKASHMSLLFVHSQRSGVSDYFIAGFWTGWIHSKDLSPRRRQEEERRRGHGVAAQGIAVFISGFMHQVR